MTVPFRDAAELEAGGTAAYLRVTPGRARSERLAGLLQINARGDQGEVAELAAEPAIHLFWRPGPPDPQSPARRLLDSLARRGLLLEPFERIPAGLQEALAVETAP